jgi:hypothetical protein
MGDCPWAPGPALEGCGVIIACIVIVVGIVVGIVVDVPSGSSCSLPSSLPFFFFFGVSLLKKSLILSLLDGFPFPSLENAATSSAMICCLGEGERVERSKRTDVAGIAVVETDRSNGLGGLDTGATGRSKGSEDMRRL